MQYLDRRSPQEAPEEQAHSLDDPGFPELESKPDWFETSLA